MCVARTAALHGGNEKQKVHASRDFLQQFLHHVQKCSWEAKIHEKQGVRASKTIPERSKIELGGRSNAKKTAKTGRKCRRSVQEAAKNEKKAPKSDKGANMAPT